MNPRQRIRTALSHQQPDRLPIDFGGLAEYCIQAALPPEKVIAIYEAAAEFR